VQALRILVVEDHPDTAEVLTEMLLALGHSAFMALDSETALLLADKIEPQLAMVDLGLPRIDGFELALRLRKRFPALRLIGVTGFSPIPTCAGGARFDGMMLKPFDFDVVESMVRESRI
jgi:DNA-binding response OmpR family regulator